MASALSYVIFHPDAFRSVVEVTCRVLEDGRSVRWRGGAVLDATNKNSDPLISGATWHYSYCHATQLRRSPHRKDGCVGVGSVLFFCSGESADADELQIDTVFVITKRLEWRSTRRVPREFAALEGDRRSVLWTRHLRSGVRGDHPGKFTYEAKSRKRKTGPFTCLPQGGDGAPLVIPFSALPVSLRRVVRQKRKGKRPALLTSSQVEWLWSEVVHGTKRLLYGTFTET